MDTIYNLEIICATGHHCDTGDTSADLQRANNAVITSKRRCNVVLT